MRAPFLTAVLTTVLPALVACAGSTDPAPSARVRFVVDAPFCGDAYPVNFFIDDNQVGRDTLWFGVGADTSPIGAMGLRHFKSYRSFAVGAGRHTVRAAIVDTVPPFPRFPPFIYGWPDTILTVSAGAEGVRTLSFYCS